MLAAATGEGREANARALANSLVESDLIALALATHGVLRFANPAFCTLFGRSGGVVGILVPELVIDAYRSQIEAALQAAMADSADCVAIALRADGTTLDVEFRLGKAALEGEALVLLIAQDITERHRAAEQLGLLPTQIR